MTDLADHEPPLEVEDGASATEPGPTSEPTDSSRPSPRYVLRQIGLAAIAFIATIALLYGLRSFGSP